MLIEQYPLFAAIFEFKKVQKTSSSNSMKRKSYPYYIKWFIRIGVKNSHGMFKYK